MIGGYKNSGGNMTSACSVTGGRGFIGSRVIDMLIEKVHSVGGVDDLSTDKAGHWPVEKRRGNGDSSLRDLRKR